MSNGYRQVDFNLEARLAGVNFSPAERADALAKAEKAEQFVAAAQWIIGVVKRLTEAKALKPSRA